jgi:hypothetical protein
VIVSAPRPEIAHWLTASVILFLGLVLLSEAIVGTEAFRRRAWRAYLFPVVVIAGSVLLWLIAALSTFSTMHLVAHSVWAQAAMIAGGVQLALVRGKISHPAWSLVNAVALVVTGASFLIHEQNTWLFSRSAFLHHLIGWVLVVGAVFPIGQALRPARRPVWVAGFALVFVTTAALLFADRDLAPIFGHLSDLEGQVAR